jgi:hypothetical protein
MPTPTYTALATVTLGSSASSVTFSSIPATYRDLVVVTNVDGTLQSNYWLRLNGDTGSNYSYVFARGNGTTASSSSSAGQTSMRLNGDADVMTDFSHVAVLSIMDYSATDKHKTVLIRPNTASRAADMGAGRFASTSAITSVLLFLSTGNFDVGSTFNLYGIAS